MTPWTRCTNLHSCSFWCFSIVLGGTLSKRGLLGWLYGANFGLGDLLSHARLVICLERVRISALNIFHYSDVKMSTMASQITGVSIVYLTVCLFQIKASIKAPRHWPLWWESTGDRWIPRSQRASNAGNVYIWWRHHVILQQKMFWDEKSPLKEKQAPLMWDMGYL